MILFKIFEFGRDRAFGRTKIIEISKTNKNRKPRQRDSALILTGALDLSTRSACESTVLLSLYGARLVEQDFKN
jgi:hypothetical protein